MKPAPGSVVLQEFHHEPPRLEPLRSVFPGPVMAKGDVHQFDLRLLVIGDENARAVMVMLKTWLGNVGAPVSAEQHPALEAAGTEVL